MADIKSSFGNIFSLVGAMADGYITLVGESAKCTGKFVSNAAEDVTRYTGGKNDDDTSTDDEDCGWNVTTSGSVDDCVDAIDRSVAKFHRSLDERRDEEPHEPTVKVTAKAAARSSA